MDLSIIIVNYDVYDDVCKCIDSIYRYLNSQQFEIIVIDNNSNDRIVSNINDVFKNVKLIELNHNRGFGFACNLGMKVATGKYILIVNPDILFLDDSIQKMLRVLEENSKAGVVGPLQYKPGVGLEYYYTFFPSIYSRIMQENRMYMKTALMKKRFFDFIDNNIKKGQPFKVDWVIGSCLMTKKQIYNDIGGFDEAFFLFEEETEWQYRMHERGWISYIDPAAKVIHNHHSSTGKLGSMFVYYHEFRSRIVFDRKRFKGIKYIFRFLLIFVGLMLRVIYFLFRSLTNKIFKIKFRSYYDLFIFNLQPRNGILKSRFDFDGKKNMFSLN